MNHDHYHIRWSRFSGSTLDWEAFQQKEDAERRARELMRPDESYTIQQFNGDCPRCAGTMPPAGS